jgi:ribonuclease HII
VNRRAGRRREPAWTWERRAAARGFRRPAGIDEVGRGCLAGPVVAAAVVLDGPQGLAGLRDSKRLTPRQRESWSAALRRRAVAWSLGEASAEEVDGLNILEATRLAMRRAVRSLSVAPDLLLVDAVRIPGLELPQWPLVRGDERSLSIAAASVVAKVHRDRLMSCFDSLFPDYHFARNKGYGTAAHLAALRRRGPCPLHRLSFQGADGRPA